MASLGDCTPALLPQACAWRGYQQESGTITKSHCTRGGFRTNDTRLMPNVAVTRRISFNAAHRLHNPKKSDEWNRKMYGKCNSPNWHGHNYELFVTIEGEPDPVTGFVFDLGVLKQILQEHVMAVVDHKNLNLDVPFMEGVLTSTENFAVGIWNQIEPHIHGGTLTLVRLVETENNMVEYRGE